MANRQITIGAGTDFVIQEKGLEFPKRGETECKVVLGAFYVNKNKTIAAIFDAFAPSLDEIEILKEDKRFLEVCDFEVEDLFKFEVVATFTGTWIEALEWLNKRYENLRTDGMNAKREKWLKEKDNK
ncbi:MAG: hypothetical protein LBQ52_08495 [Helicobacteraceae bacterium]|jgi:hypothetical protein|nr:hypothetical protein [Helicobacteraceae bacterium]